MSTPSEQERCAKAYQAYEQEEQRASIIKVALLLTIIVVCCAFGYYFGW